jgi:hypothetical protein
VVIHEAGLVRVEVLRKCHEGMEGEEVQETCSDFQMVLLMLMILATAFLRMVMIFYLPFYTKYTQSCH